MAASPKPQAGTMQAASARPAPSTPAKRPSSPKGKPIPDVDGVPADQRPRASAGHILAVGLVCFMLWLLFDANQLYRSAEAGAIGARRTVAITILRPIAAATNALGISGPVNTANSLLGKCGLGGEPVCGGSVPFVVQPPRPPGYLGLGAAPHLGAGSHYIAPPGGGGPPPLVSPTASHPLTLLSIGDSIGEDLGFGLGDVFSTDPAVHVIQEGVESTGLARSDYYNWPGTLEVDLARDHPQIVVVMLGANDAQALYINGRYLAFNTPKWWQAYGARVGLVIDEGTAAGAHVMWVGLPPMGPGSTVPAWFLQQLNRIFLHEVRIHPGATYFPAAKVLATKSGKFTEYISVRGTLEQIRSTDGVHLLPPGYDLLARALVKPMQQAWQINLRVGP
jgi:lysophospholipase L1-like esterase